MNLEVWTPPLDRPTGGNLYDREISEALHRRGARVFVRQFHPGRLRAETVRGLPPGDTDAVVQDAWLHALFRPLNRLRRLRPRRPPLIALVHHLASDERERPEGERAALRQAETAYLGTVDAVISPSRASANAALGRRGRPAPSAVVPPGGDRVGGAPLPERMPTDEEIAARAREPGPLRVLFLGGLTRRKRLHELLRAVERTPGVTLSVVGGGEAEPEYAASARKRAAALGGRVEIEGPLGGGALAARLRRAQILAVPSTHEGFGMVYLEAFAFGLPVIAAASGGAGEFVREGENGWLVGSARAGESGESGDSSGEDRAVGEIAERLREAAESREKISAMGLRAAAAHRAWPSWEDAAARVEDLVRRLPAGESG